MAKFTPVELYNLFTSMNCKVNIGTGENARTVAYVDAAELPINSIEFLFRYGTQQKCVDKVADPKKYVGFSSKVAGIESVIENLYNGVTGRTPAEMVDDVTTEARKIMNVRLYNKNRPVYDKVKAMADKAARNAALDKLIAANPDVLESAKKVIETRAAEAEVTLNVDIDL